MIDISDKTEEELNALIQKYASVLQLVKDKRQVAHFAVILDYATTYMNENHQDLSGYWKTWVIVVIRNLYKSIDSKEDINKIIDEFIEYYKTHYQSFLDDMILKNIESVSEFDMDSLFVFPYIMNPEIKLLN